MNDKILKKLITLLLILIVFWIGKNYLEERTQMQNSNEGKIDLPLSSSEIKRIEISFNSDVVVMQKRDNIWFNKLPERNLGDDQAKVSDVEALLKIVEPSQIKLISTNANKHTELGVDSTSGATVKFFTEPESTESKLVLLVSKENPQLFRQDQMANVYQWSDELARIVQQDTAMWTAPTPTPTIIEESTPSSINSN